MSVLYRTKGRSLNLSNPVIATAHDGITEQVEDGATGFWFQEVTLAEWRIEHYNYEPLRRKLAHNAAHSAKRRFDLKRQINDYLSWYQEIIDQMKEHHA